MRIVRWIVVAGLALIVLLNLLPVMVITAARLGLVDAGEAGDSFAAVGWGQLLLWLAAIAGYAAAAYRAARGRGGALRLWAIALLLDLARYGIDVAVGARGPENFAVDGAIYAVVLALGLGLYFLERPAATPRTV